MAFSCKIGDSTDTTLTDAMRLELLLIGALLCRLTAARAAVIVHNNVASAVSHQSFTRLPHDTLPAVTHVQLQLQTGPAAPVSAPTPTPTLRIASSGMRRLYAAEPNEPILGHTPAHLTFAASPVVHQTLPRIKPLRESLDKKSRNALLAGRAAELEPFALWICNIWLTYAGDILGNILVGNLPLEPLCDGSDVFYCTVVWYLMFYCPFDLCYKVARMATFRIITTNIGVISQMLLIDRGIQAAAQVYDNALVPMILVGAIMGSGAELIGPTPFKFQQKKYSSIKLTINSKLAFCISLFLALIVNHSHLLGALTHQLKSYLLVALITFKYMSMACGTIHTI